MSPPNPPPSLLDRLRKFDPAVLPILVAGIVLVGAVIWLLGRPLPQPQQASAPDAETSRRLAALEARTVPAAPDLGPLNAALQAANQRIAALEQRPAPAAPDLAPLNQAIAAATQRAEAAQRQGAALEERLAATARDLAARPQLDPDTFAPRREFERLADAVAGLARDQQAAGAQAQQRVTAAEQAIAGFAGRVAANEAALASRTQALESQAARIGSVEQQLAARIAQLEGQLQQRGQTIEQQAGRIAQLEQAAQRLAALEGRSARMAALDQVRTALEGGQPLGPALGPISNPPEALARFAQQRPPTEAQLRLSFDEAARAALVASEPSREGSGVMDGALARLQGLVTVRRGEEVLWGDAAAAEIERARRAVEAGDIAGALRHLQRLSAPARQAMGNWIAQAEALVAARAALRQLAAG